MYLYAETETQHCDVLIVGGGSVGLTVLNALADSGLSIAVIEGRELPAPITDPFDSRVSALTIATQRILQNLKVWPEVLQHRLSSFHQMSVWDGEGTASVEFAASEIGAPCLGHIIENSTMQHCLWQRAKTIPSVTWYCPARMIQLVKRDDAWRVTLADGTRLTATIVVAADGVNSDIRSIAQFDVRRWDYDHHALVATVRTERPHQSTARQCFTGEGVLAFLPLSDDMPGQESDDASWQEAKHYFSSIVWSVPPSKADALMSLSDGEFKKMLGCAFEYRLGRVLSVSDRYRFPLQQQHAVDYTRPGLALVGDAAHSFHPLAGQGVNMGMLDATVLAEEIIRAQSLGLDLADYSVLRRYERRRKGHNLLMMGTVEGFKRGFEFQSLWARWIRNGGMSLLNRHSLVKHEIIEHAMGLKGDLPWLARSSPETV